MGRIRAFGLVLVLAACGGDGEAPQRATTPAETAATTAADTAADEQPGFDLSGVETVVGGLEVPWAIAFAGDGVLLVTERPGRVRVVKGGRLRDEPAAEIDVDASGESGLLGIALHPDFPDERFAYLYYTHASGNRVSRFRVTENLRLENEELLIGEIPSASLHDGGRIAFGPDGQLYVTTGDAGEPARGADQNSLAGKILRLTPEGDVPPDNPFGDSPVWSYGHRNSQGLAWDADGTLYASEHGPSGELGLCCHDEVNRIEAGGFYGWPFRAGEAETGLGAPPEDPVAPVVASGDDTWAPAGLAAAEGRLYLALLAGERLLAIEPDAPDVETALEGYGRLRVATVGPDGCLYLATSNRDGRGNPAENDDRILRAC